eukprot:1696822-Alexandrium_andersonii.AAC.1
MSSLRTFVRRESRTSCVVGFVARQAVAGQWLAVASVRHWPSFLLSFGWPSHGPAGGVARHPWGFHPRGGRPSLGPQR